MATKARELAEVKLGRALQPGEVVHHSNGDGTDNRPENLVVLGSKQEHGRAHAQMRLDYLRTHYPGYLTTRQAAERLGIGHAGVRHLIRTGTLKAIRLTGCKVDEDDVEKAKGRRRRGRPPKREGER